MKPAILTLLAAGAALAAHSLVLADSGRSLNQVRTEMNNGTWAGISIWDSRPKAAPPAAAASGSAAAAAQGASAPVGAGPRVGGLLGWGAPPSGQPLSSAKHLDSPTLGIELPTASTGENAASDTATKAK
jgi:hypothetical protein